MRRLAARFMTEERKIEDLFLPFKFLGLNLKNRIVMSSMSRYRTGENFLPLPINKVYYKQRSGAGLIFSETLSVSQQGLPSYYSQGLWNSQQIEAWKQIVDEVHSNNSFIFAQLGHGGPVSHSSFNSDKVPISPSGINPHTFVLTPNGKVETQDPNVMTSDDFKRVFDEFMKAARNAKKAGFDGVQIHGTSGGLIDNILRGIPTPENKEICSNFVIHLMNEISEEFGDRVGIKIAPTCTYNNLFNSNPSLFLINFSNSLKSNFVSFVEIKYGEENVSNIYRETPTMQIPVPHRELGKVYNNGHIIANLKSVREAYSAFINEEVDLISFGKYWVSNPDLVERLKNNISLAEPDESTYYTQDEKGFIDYPSANN